MSITKKIFLIPCALRAATLEKTPLGAITIICSDQGLASLTFGPLALTRTRNAPQFAQFEESGRMIYDPEGLSGELRQIEEYFQGVRRSFQIDLDWRILTPFQSVVLQKVMQIPYGKVSTYARLATSVQHPRAVRAVGGANAANPIPLVIPCHRVVGSDLGLRGYGSLDGLQTKVWLLRHEGLPVPLSVEKMEAGWMITP